MASCSIVIALSLLFVGVACDNSSELFILQEAPWARNLGWKGNNISTPCILPGIACNAVGKVSTMCLGNHQLRGTLPASWSQLTNLMELRLEDNILTGTLPSQWSELKQLQTLKLENNSFTGQLPSSWAQLQQLHVLSVSYNNLSGSLPVTYSQLSQLQYVYLRINSLTGNLPAGWQQLQSLTMLDLGSNQLTGVLPTSWQHLQSLIYLELDKNRLTSTLPESWANLSQLRTLQLGDNKLTGHLPDSWSQLHNLTVLDLTNNFLQGTLSARWSQLGRLQNLNLSANQLTGPLPAEWAQLQNIIVLDLCCNQLNASLPEPWAGLGQLRILILSLNRLSGTLPANYSYMPQLQDLDAYGNLLTGRFPSSWARWPTLKTLKVHNNQLNGTLPGLWIYDDQMSYLDISSNFLRGILPSYLLSMNSLIELNASYNLLSGTLPSAIGRSLQKLSVEHNYLTGTLPEGWSSAIPQAVNLSHNMLRGTLPLSWFSSVFNGSLHISYYTDSVLDLSYNNFNGSVLSRTSIGTPANVTLDPMNAGFGFCGPVPNGTNVLSAQNSQPLPHGTSFPNCQTGGSPPVAAPAPAFVPVGAPTAAMPGSKGSHPSGSSSLKIIIPAAVGAVLATLLVVAFAVWHSRRRKAFRQHHPGGGLPKAGAQPVPIPSLNTELDDFDDRYDYGAPFAYVLQSGMHNPAPKQPLLDRLAVHNRLRVMGAIERGEVDVGPLLGRGAFGRVYKGRWRGTLVAIKMVEHAAGANALEQAEKIEREALLSTSLSHPNVITTFKVSTMFASTAQALRSASSADTDWSAPNMPRTPRSPQQPGSASEDGASSHRSYMDSASTLHSSSLPDSGHSSAQATHRDSAMSEHGGGGLRVLQNPFRQAPADRPADVPRESLSSACDRGGLGSASPGDDGGAATTAVQPAFDSAASNAGRRAPVSQAEEEEYVLSPEEMAAEDDPDAVEERHLRLLETWCLMDYAERGSLADALRTDRLRRADNGMPNLACILQCLHDVANGMDYLHSAGILHGDLKPANVLLKSASEDARSFTCKLCDFGLSRLLDAAEKTHLSTQTHGTMPYMPPELLEHSQLTPAADTYSFGMIMWECFTGQVPFQGLTIGQVYSRVVHSGARPPLDAFDAAKERCAEERPALAAYTALLEACWSAQPSLRPLFKQVLGELSAVRGLLPLQAQGSLGSPTRSRYSSLGAPRRSPRALGAGR